MKYFLLITFGLIITAFGYSEAQNCSITCLPSSLNDTETCNVTSGECLYGCEDGYTGGNCTVACPDHCASPTPDEDDYCNETTMACTSGCNVGFAGIDCTVACPTNCKHPLLNGSDTCNSTSGECLNGCSTGYTGANCSMECPINCAPQLEESINMCNASNGECSHGCVKGFAGPNCTVECPANCALSEDDSSSVCDPDTGNCTFGCKFGFAGPNCSTVCPMNCSQPSEFADTCDEYTLECSFGCDDGLMGPTCTQLCPQNCRSPNNVCDAISGECLFGCNDGFAGDNCSFVCPQNCNPSLSNSTDICNATTGECLLGCNEGFAGDNCSFVCPQNCNPSLSNLTDMCNATSGECLFGCTHGFAGPNCSEPCPDNCARTIDPNIDTCDAETGECSSGCFYGFTGDNCTVPCPTNCATFPEGGEQITCNATTLECTNGCDVTYTGSYCNDSCSTNCDRCNNPSECTECKKDSYRDDGKCIDCAWQCNHATDSTLRICREDDGRCEFGCLAGYYGQRCKTRCSSTCKDNVCERLGGECLNGCVTPELTGLTCDKRCNAGCKGIKCDQSGICLDGCFPTFWGASCDNLCSDNCREGSTSEANICKVSDGTCLYGCKDDLHWENQCTTECSAFCVNGVCEQMSGNCTGGCSSDEVYGIDCKKPCNTNCVNGTCFRDGFCKLGCLDGWYGDHCDKQCGSKCYDDVCDRDDGSCTSGCETGWYGTHCTETCGLNCVNKTCYIDTGNCTLGCVFGSQGPKCDQVITLTPSPPAAIDALWLYIGIAVAGVIVIGIIVIIILVARRRKIIIERRRRTTMYENYPSGLQEKVERREKKKKTGPVARITQMLVENPLALLMRGNRGQPGDDDIGANTKIAVDDLLDMVIQAEESGGNEEFDNLKPGLTKPHDESRKLENLALNFFSEIFPYDDNRVVLGHGKRREDTADHQHSIMKDKTHGDRHGNGKSVHFPVFGNSSKPSDKKNTTGLETVKANEDASSEPGTSGGNKSVDIDQETVVFSKGADGDRSDGQVQIGMLETKAQSDGGPKQNVPKRDYINASYIKAQNGKIGYIAAQAPAKSTVNDFWLMIWEQQPTMIVMLTGTDDDGNLKCEKYWPDTGSSQTFGNINVTCKSCDVYVIHTLRRFKIQNGEDGEERDLIHHQFTDWPDHGCPASAISLIEFHQRNKSLRGLNTTDSLVVVHCTAGVGRTGVFIGLDYLVDEGTATGYVNIYKCVEKLREQRVNMVQGSDQYDFLYKALAQLFALECGLVNRSSMQDMLTRLRKVDIEHGGKQKLEYLFKNLRDSLTLDTSEIASLDVVQERSRKDRPTSDVPDMLYRARLPNGMYINAVTFDTFKYRDALVATQMPTPETLSDFCQLLLHNKCDTVVMLNTCDPNDKSVGYYWPKHKKHVTIGNMKVTTVEEDKKSDIDFVIRKLKLEVKQTDQGSPVRDITMIQYKGWKIVKNVPNVKNLLKLLTLCRKYVNISPDRHLLVHCMNGSEQSGLFCALYNILDQLDTESDLSITCIVRSILARLPSAIPSVNQLETCFSAACTHIAESAMSLEE